MFCADTGGIVLLQKGKCDPLELALLDDASLQRGIGLCQSLSLLRGASGNEHPHATGDRQGRILNRHIVVPNVPKIIKALPGIADHAVIRPAMRQHVFRGRSAIGTSSYL